MVWLVYLCLNCFEIGFCKLLKVGLVVIVLCDDWMNNLGIWEEDWSKVVFGWGIVSCVRVCDDEDIV